MALQTVACVSVNTQQMSITSVMQAQMSRTIWGYNYTDGMINCGRIECVMSGIVGFFIHQIKDSTAYCPISLL